ncbi:hypothetical protein [Mangrovibacterium sp.]|uniref:hypothetical protein n=1 Tax=Mangrovibacterium sp. TaxID=1961364 RepID=UPI0035689196
MKNITDEFTSLGIHEIDGPVDKFGAVFTEDSRNIFDYEDVKPKDIKKGYRGYVPWGEDNEQPCQMLEKIRADEVMSSNMWFNIATAYGRGFVVTEKGQPVATDEIKRFFRRNNMVKYWSEQFTDMKHFFFSVLVLIVDNEGKKVVQIRHKEAINCRFETCNPDTGRIENIFYANWKDKPEDENVTAIPLLDEDDPIGDLMIRFGKEPNPKTGKNDTPTKERIFAIVNRVPTPGMKYYPFPYYASTFNSGWSVLKAMIPIAKIAKMKNGMVIKYLVELHKDYFNKLFSTEQITDPEKKKARQKLEIENIKSFLSGVENQNKSWFSTYYIDPNGKEQKMVRIERVGGEKEGGDYIEDAEEAANIVSYAMGVHPSLIGSSPGKGKNINGTEARELFTMKQAMEKLPRDIMMGPYYVLIEFNGWELEFDIPDLMLTTLDQKTDAKETSQKTQPDDTNND